MSAHHDKSQGITFVFSNIHEIYRNAKNARLDAPFVAPKVARAPDLGRAFAAPSDAQTRVFKARDLPAGLKIEPFQPAEVKPEESKRTHAVPMGVREAEEKAKRQAARPLANLQKNLGDLEDAHAKLRFLLQELEGLTKKKS